MQSTAQTMRFGGCSTAAYRAVPSACALSRLSPPARRVTRILRAGKADEPGPLDSLEDLFSAELKKRGMSVNSLDADDSSSATKTKATPKDPFGSGSSARSQPASTSAPSGAASSTQTKSRTPPPQPPPLANGGQRERSMALVTEGLEGLPGRAGELIKLGGSLFLAFLPAMFIFSLLFSIIYLSVGSSFVHGGALHSAPPAYDVEKLLSEPTVDPYVTF